MADPFGLSFGFQDPFASLDPFDDLLGPMPRRRSALPPLSPEEEASLLGTLGGGMLSGLQWTAESLDKPGRAIRGLLDGRPSELLNLIPFSDTMGLTDPTQSTSGRDLLEHYGMLAPNQEGFDTGDLAGFGVELATDPLTFVGGFLGRAAGMPGKISRAAGITDDITRAAKAAGVGAREFNVGHTLADVMPLLDDTKQAALGTAATKYGSSLDDILQEPLGGLAEVGIPFTGIKTSVGHGDWSKTLARGADTLGAAVKASPVGRATRMLFDPSVQGKYDPLQQELAENAFKLQPEGKRAARTVYSDSLDQLEEVHKAFSDVYGASEESAKQLDRIIRMTGETAGDVDTAFNEIMPGVAVDPNVGSRIKDVASTMQSVNTGTYADFLDNGGSGGWLPEHEGTEHMPRSVDRRGSGDTYPGREYKTGADAAKSRTVATRHMPAEIINRLLTDEGARGAELTKSQKQMRSLADEIMASGVKSQNATIQADIEALTKRDFTADAAKNHILKNYDRWLGYETKSVKDGEEIVTAVSKEQHAEQLAKWVKEHSQKPLYTQATVDDQLKYHLGLQKANSSMTAIHDFFAGHLGKPGIDLQTAYSFAGMNPPMAIAKLAQRLGKPVAEVSKLTIPLDVAAAAGALKKTVSSPEYAGKIGGWVDKLNGLFKKYVTLPYPGFVARNFTSGQFTNLAMSGLVENPQDFARYSQAFRAAMQPSPELLREANIYGLVGRTAFEDVDQGSGASLFPSNPLNVKQTFQGAKQAVEMEPSIVDKIPGAKATRVGLNTVTGTGGKANQLAEWMNRIPMYVYLKEKGWTPAAAAAKSQELHFDYGSIAPFERDIMKRVAPFYVFSRKMGELTLRTLADKPGGPLAQTIRATNKGREKDGFTPPYISQTTAIPLGEQEDGKQRYLTGLGLPHEDVLGLVNFGGSPLKTAENVVSELLGRVTPYAKAPLEIAAGKQFYTGRDLRDLDSSLERIMQNTTGSQLDVPPLVEEIAMNLPISRAITTARQLTDPRKGIGAKAVNLGTGLKVSDVDLDKYKSIATRELLEEQLRGQPGVSVFEHLSFPEESLALMSPEEQQLARLYKTLGNRAQKESRERKKQRAAAF
jgi:hypothetical protein